MKNEMIIDGVAWVPKSQNTAPTLDGMKYCIVRTYSAGVFAGYVESQDGQEVVMREARRLWQWAGAASLSQMAMSGTNKPADCKFPEPVNRVTLTQGIEVIECTPKAMKSIKEVEIWQA